MASVLGISRSLLSFVNLMICRYSHKKDIDLLKEVVCFNQGELAQYNYMASEKHKDIKDALRSKNPETADVGRCIRELETHLNIEIGRIFRTNIGLFEKYFTGRSEIEPRICTKVIKNDLIVELIRELEDYHRINYHCNENTGFDHVNNTGKFYFCNDIPDEVKKSRYLNPRLYNDKANRYKKPLLNWFYQKCGREDSAWVDCWITKESLNNKLTRPYASHCYKSTIITPMTLLSNNLSPEFRNRFRIPSPLIPKKEDENALYGFLCVDHQNTHYFNREMDKPVSFIFADLMSLYLIINLTYAAYSKTYHEAKDFCRLGDRI